MTLSRCVNADAVRSSSMTSPSPRVSIGLPVYNGGRFLAATLDSLLAQSLCDFELIISDSASTDETQDLCHAYAARDPRVRYFPNFPNRANLGAGHNYRRVVELSRGELFEWAGADDPCEPAYLARCVEILDADPRVAPAYPRARFIDEEGNVLPLTDPFVPYLAAYQSPWRWRLEPGRVPDWVRP